MVCPPPKTPRVPLDVPAGSSLAADKSPKSCAFPVDAIVIKLIEFTFGLEPAQRPLVA